MAAELEPARVAETVTQTGIATVPGYLSSEELAKVSALFDSVMVHGEVGYRVNEHPPGKILKVSTDGSSPCAKAVAQLFNTPQLNEIRSLCFLRKKDAPVTVREVVFTYDYRGGDITDIHFDTRRALKFMIYLDDTTEENGAFRYASGTHLDNAEYRRLWLASGRRVRDLPNIKGEQDFASLQSLELPRGSLLIFDTEGFHAGGFMRAARTRRVLRAGSAFPGQPLLYPPPLSKQWLSDKLSALIPKGPIETLGRQATRGRARKA